MTAINQFKLEYFNRLSPVYSAIDLRDLTLFLVYRIKDWTLGRANSFTFFNVSTNIYTGLHPVKKKGG